MQLHPTVSSKKAGRGPEAPPGSPSWQTWFLAALITLLLNGALFLILPAIIGPGKVQPGPTPLVQGIEVIRIKRVEPPPRSKENKAPPPERKKPEKQEHLPPRPVMPPKLTLPFTLNPKMPAAPNDLQLPMVATAPLQPGTIDGVSVHQLDKPLNTLSRIPPSYPLRARRRGIEGKVIVRFLVDEEGAVRQLSIVDADPPGTFEKSVLQCVAKWRYTPGTVESVPVRTWVETTISFKLE